MKKTLPLGIAAIVLGAVAMASGQVLYSDDFQTGAGDAASWNINTGPGAGSSAATFGYDYSTLGIPSAPHSIGGSTIGVKLEANYLVSGQSLGGVSISPKSQAFGTSYKVTFDFWSNMVGPGAGAGSGTTQITGAGVGTSGTIVQSTGTTAPTSVYFGQTGDGGNGLTTQDFRAYSSAAVGGGTATTGVGYIASSGVWAAGTGTTAVDNANAYYSPLGGNAVPAGETGTGAPSGTTAAGAPAFAWHTGEVLKLGNTITYSIDGLLIATVDASALTLDGQNILLLQSDVNAGASTAATVRTWQFGLFDNVIVAAPEPTTWALSVLGVAGMFFFRRRAK